MRIENQRQELYRAVLEKKTEYDGTFFVGVKTTGVFCRPTCPARKPKLANCVFFENAQQALLASFRPCKRCRPLDHPNHVSKLIHILIEALEKNPEKRWGENDFQKLPVDASTVRRQFKKRFGITFVEYARAQRMGCAIHEIRSGKPIIEAQLSTGYESSSGFRDAFARIIGTAPSEILDHNNVLKASWLDTPLGPMIAIADEQALYLLEFADCRDLEREIERLKQKTRAAIIPGQTQPLQSIEKELKHYFEGLVTEFKTPLLLIGSPFQKSVWEELKKIPYGHTLSYSALAAAIGKPSACRAVAQANGANQLAIVIPCHRVINASGQLGGYAGGVARKQWLLKHETTRRIR